jgi:carbon-monoxide dehydrogenase medium subunit
MLPPFEYSVAESLGDVFDALGVGAVPYCGGTELIPAMQSGLLAPASLVSLRKLTELNRIYVDGDDLVIGATSRHDDVAASPLVREDASLLAEIAGMLGNSRVRATGTIGGNIAFAEPRSDVINVLMALNASVVVLSDQQRRVVPVQQFVQSAYYVDLAQDSEIIEAVTIRRNGADYARYERFAITERPSVGVAVTHNRDDLQWQVTVGSVDDECHVWRGGCLAEFDFDEFESSLDLVDDAAGTAEYKVTVASGIVRRMLAQATAERG